MYIVNPTPLHPQATETQCILNKDLAEKEKAGILRFTLDFRSNRTLVRCSRNIRSITILESDSSEAEQSLGPLSDSQMFRPKRSMNDPDAAFSPEAAMSSQLVLQLFHIVSLLSLSALYAL